jgi:myo-inositol-1(or 4)-monophosphatase
VDQDRVVASLSSTEIDELLALATEASVHAGKLLMTFFEGPAAGVSSKTSHTDLVSDADRASEKLLLDAIDKARPGDGVLAEEGSARDSTSGYTWVLDPLDGTINFLFGIPVWSVSVAVQDAEGTAVGVVHDPCRGETFAARRGGGATLNGGRVAVSDKDDVSTALIGTGFSYEPEARSRQAEVVARVLPVVRDIRRAGSAALDLAAVSCGRLDGFYEGTMEPWDKAAGALLIIEAGGVVTELDPPLAHLSPGVIAAGPALHGRLSEVVLGHP